MRKHVLALALVTGASGAFALQPIEKDPTVYSGFYSIGLADTVRKNCDEIDARFIAAYRFIKSLERYAKKAGYTDADIKALEKNKDAKKKLRQHVNSDLKKRGASPESPEGYCTVGHEEIAKDSAAGRLLRAR